MTVACIAEELQCQQRSYRAGGRDHLRPGESSPGEELVQAGGLQPWEEQEQAAELGAETARRQVELADVGDFGNHGAGLVGTVVVEPPRQLGEALHLQNRGDGRRTQRLAVTGECAADVVDGEVLLPQRDHLFPQSALLARGSTDSCGQDEEVAFGLIAKLMHQDAKAAGRVTESIGHFGGGNTLDEEGSEGFVLPMGGVGGRQEAASQC